MKITIKVVGIAIGIMALVLLFSVVQARETGDYAKATFDLILAVVNFKIAERMMDYKGEQT